MQEIYTNDEILINAPSSRVWDTLVNPETTIKYMFGCKVNCNWQLGSPILWEGATDGITYVKGTLLQFDKEKVFSFTVFDPNSSYADIPANHLTSTYTLMEENGNTLLKVSQGNYATVAEGQKRYDDTMAQGGWEAILSQIKTLAEQG